jgi:hypothetical protein
MMAILSRGMREQIQPEEGRLSPIPWTRTPSLGIQLLWNCVDDHPMKPTWITGFAGHFSRALRVITLKRASIRADTRRVKPLIPFSPGGD